MAAGQDTADLEIAAFNPNRGAISDLADNAASLTNGANTIVGGGTTYDSAAPYDPSGTCRSRPRRRMRRR